MLNDMMKMNIPAKLKAMISQFLDIRRYELRPVRVKAGRMHEGMPLHRQFPGADKDLMRWK